MLSRDWEPAGDVSDPTSPTPTTSTPGTYTLTVTDVYTGCVGSDTTTVGTDVAAATDGAALSGTAGLGVAGPPA